MGRAYTKRKYRTLYRIFNIDRRTNQDIHTRKKKQRRIQRTTRAKRRKYKAKARDRRKQGEEMTTEEVKKAIINKEQVRYTDITYTVQALIYRYRGNKWRVTAELLDKNNNSISIADIKKIEKNEK